MNEWWWYLTRASGIVATVLAVGSLVFGAFFSARNTGSRRTPAWWLDLHNYLGGLALIFTGVHVLASVMDPNSGIGLIEVLIPGTAKTMTWAVTWGVLATYTFVIAVFTSWPRRRFSRKAWRWLHLTSVAGVAVAGIHGFQLGSDANTTLFEIGLLLGAGISVYAIALRTIGAVSPGGVTLMSRRIHSWLQDRTQDVPRVTLLDEHMTGETRPPTGDPMLDRLERLAARQGRATASGTTPAAPTARSRRRHPARRARVGALVMSCATTGGLAYWFAGADAPQADAAIAGLAAPIATSATSTTAAPSPTAGTAAAPATTSATAAPAATAAPETTAAASDAVVAFDGNVVETRYGPVQVQAQVQGSTIVAVAVVQYPNQDGKSVRINERALPNLQSEVLTAQSAQVNTISGATYTSNAYVKSLQSAIDEAAAAGVIIA